MVAEYWNSHKHRVNFPILRLVQNEIPSFMKFVS